MATRRGKPDLEPIILARLDGTARRLLATHVPRPDAIAAIHELSTDPRVLGLAAGTALGGWRALNTHDGDRVAELLTDAGADPDIRDQQATTTEHRLAANAGPGIGNPASSKPTDGADTGQLH